jgi:pentatricopeptide repeat protein
MPNPAVTLSVVETFRKAVSLFRAGRYDVALDLYRRLANDGHARAQEYLGLSAPIRF